MLPSFGDAVVIHGDIAFFGPQHGAGRTARNDGLQLLAVPNTAADFIDHAEEVEAHRQLVDTGLVDVTGEAEQPCAAVLRCAQIGEPLTTIAG